MCERAPIGHFAPIGPRSAKIVTDGDVPALAPETHPVERCGLSSAVNVQDARQGPFADRGRATECEHADLYAVSNLTGKAKLLIMGFAFRPGFERFDIE